jgi:hypothetical protein
MTYTQLQQDHKHHKIQANLVTVGKEFLSILHRDVCVCFFFFPLAKLRAMTPIWWLVV